MNEKGLISESSGAFIVGMSNSQEHVFQIVIEKTMVLRDIRSFSDAVMFLFALHYVFDLEYNAPYTFDFLQRYIVKIGASDKKESRRVSVLARSLNI